MKSSGTTDIWLLVFVGSCLIGLCQSYAGLPGVNMSLIQGDIILSPRQLQFRKYNGARNVAVKERDDNRWHNNVVPYQLSTKYTDRESKIIISALQRIEQVSCFKFPQRSTEADFLDIDKRDGCYSYVGRVGGRQLLSLSEGCVYSFIIIHEVMHVLGLEHEHQRPDRDQFIKILYKNVEEDKLSNFGVISAQDVDYKEHPYDYLSIMHYDGTAFGKTDRRTGEKLVTMVPLKAGIELHDNYELTKLDIAKLNSLGKCGEQISVRTTGKRCYDAAENCINFVQQNLCKNAIYKELMMERCALTCGFCSKENITALNPVKSACHDTIAECPTFASNGFCDNKFYDPKVCAQSCGLCPS